MIRKISVFATLALIFIAGPIYAEKIIVVTHGQANDAFWNVVKNGVEQASKDMKIDVDYRHPESFDMVAMSQLIKSAINQEPDGIAISIPDGDALGDSIREAVDAGIAVVSLNSGSKVAKGLGIPVHIGQDEFEAGLGAGEKMKAMGVKNPICVNHEVGNVALDQRCAGFSEGYGADVPVLPSSNDPQQLISKIKAKLESDESIDGVMTLGGSNAAEPALMALEEMGMTGSVKLGTFDLSANVLKAIAEGKMAFAIDQQQYMQGYMPIVILANHSRYGLMPGGNIPTGPGFVTKDNASKVIELSAKGIR